MFIDPKEMITVASEYKLQEIADYDSTIIQKCIIAAIQRVRRYLSGRYNVNIIFSKTGEDRDPELVEIIKNVALWFLIRRCNVDMLYDKVKESYDRDMKYLGALMSGELPAELPLRPDESGKPSGSIHGGSNPKFTHSW